MEQRDDQQVDVGRRDFLRRTGRWALALGLGGGVFALTRQRGDTSTGACAGDGACGSCDRRSSCPVLQERQSGGTRE